MTDTATSPDLLKAAEALQALAAKAEDRMVEPEDGEGDGEGIAFVKTGWVRLQVGDKRFRLRRPFLGELRSLDAEREALAGELIDLAEKSGPAGKAFTEQRKQIREDESLPDAERNKKLRAIDRKDRAGAAKFYEQRDKLVIGWWVKAFAAVGVDDPPAEGEWPAWIVDPNLPRQVIQHWQTVPLARGG